MLKWREDVFYPDSCRFLPAPAHFSTENELFKLWKHKSLPSFVHFHWILLDFKTYRGDSCFELANWTKNEQKTNFVFSLFASRPPRGTSLHFRRLKSTKLREKATEREHSNTIITEWDLASHIELVSTRNKVSMPWDQILKEWKTIIRSKNKRITGDFF